MKESSARTNIYSTTVVLVLVQCTVQGNTLLSHHRATTTSADALAILYRTVQTLARTEKPEKARPILMGYIEKFEKRRWYCRKQNISPESLIGRVIDSPDRTLLVDSGLWRGVAWRRRASKTVMVLGVCKRESRALNASG